MRPTPAELEGARPLIARVKAADPSIKRVDEQLVCAAVACRAGEFGGVPTACARAMGKTISRPSQVTEWVARLEKQVQAYRPQFCGMPRGEWYTGGSEASCQVA